jgi:hypothetical protein
LASTLKPDNTVESFVASLDFPPEDELQILVIATLKKHYDFRLRQLIGELRIALEQYKWQKADDLTSEVLFTSAYSRDLTASGSDIPCSVVYEIDNLWSTHSADRFGFRVQREIYERMDSPLRRGKPYILLAQYAHELGWNRINEGENIEDFTNMTNMWQSGDIEWQSYDGLLSQIEGIDGTALEALGIYKGYFPVARIYALPDIIGRISEGQLSEIMTDDYLTRLAAFKGLSLVLSFSTVVVHSLPHCRL